MIRNAADNAYGAPTSADARSRFTDSRLGRSPLMRSDAMRHTDHCSGPDCWACQVRAGRPAPRGDVCPWHPQSLEALDRRPA